MRVLVINLSPPEILAQVLSKIKTGHPLANITVLTGNRTNIAADEIMEWRAFSPAALGRNIRSRRFEAVVISHGRDQYLHAGYWKALALAFLSGARRKRVACDGRIPGRKLLAALAAGIGGSCLLLLHYALAALFASFFLLIVILGAGASDLTRLHGGRSKGGLGTR